MDNKEQIAQDINTENIENQEETVSKQEIVKFRNVIIGLLFAAIVFSWVLLFCIMYLTPTTTRKPAIYLYPEKTTQISVKLDKTIKYNNVIPKYKKGWFVEAEPNGYLRDLQPKYTKCSKLPYKEFGFEYSKQACEINKYPYIYWDGVQLVKPLPKKEVGFIVAKNDIESFLTARADEMKFLETEKSEFVRYWKKQMQDTNWKNFKVYFLQNEEVDDYYPIYVEPKPVSSNRVQIIISKAKKNEKLPAQTLVPFNRDGYTLVEWGGIIKE